MKVFFFFCVFTLCVILLSTSALKFSDTVYFVNQTITPVTCTQSCCSYGCYYDNNEECYPGSPCCNKGCCPSDMCKPKPPPGPPCDNHNYCDQQNFSPIPISSIESVIIPLNLINSCLSKNGDCCIEGYALQAFLGELNSSCCSTSIRLNYRIYFKDNTNKLHLYDSAYIDPCSCCLPPCEKGIAKNKSICQTMGAQWFISFTFVDVNVTVCANAGFFYNLVFESSSDSCPYEFNLAVLDQRKKASLAVDRLKTNMDM